MPFSEADWGAITIGQFAHHGWTPTAGTAIAPGGENGRATRDDLFGPTRLTAAVHRFNPQVPFEYREQAAAAILAPRSADAIAENFRLHHIMVGGYRGLIYTDIDGIEQNPTIRIISHRVEDNEYLAASQVTIRDREHQRRFDVVLYLNGIPVVVVVEPKAAGAQHADLATAHAQLAAYLREFPFAFRGCVLTVVSDGLANPDASANCCATTSPSKRPTGPCATTSEPSSAHPSSGCSPPTSTRRTSNRRRFDW